MINSQREEAAGRARGARPATLRTYVVGSLVATLLLLVAVAQGSAANPNCTPEVGQALIDEGRYQQAIQVFTCVVNADPTEVEGYRGRIEAQLLLGRYSDAMLDYNRVTTAVLPAHPGAATAINASYADRLALDPESIPALTGASFARWWSFDYPQAIHLLSRLLEVRPDDSYGTLLRGSSRVLKGVTVERGLADLEQAIELTPSSPDVRWIVADAYTYGQHDPERAFGEASLALQWGLDTPRVHAILGAALNAVGETEAAAVQVQEHMNQVTDELVAAPSLARGESLALDLAPGRTYEIPIPAVAGQPIGIATSSKDYWDTIALLLAPDGTPVLGADDDNGYFAAFEHVAKGTGTYRVQVTFFESLETGRLVVTRD